MKSKKKKKAIIEDSEDSDTPEKKKKKAKREISEDSDEPER